MISSVRELLNSKRNAQIAPPPPNSQSAQRNSFNDEDVQYVAKKTVKLDNSKSSVPENPPKLEDFRTKVNEILSHEEEQKKVAFELTKKFLGLFKDKTLDEQKNPKDRDAEKNIIRDLVDFARIINSDSNQEEDLGTISFLITLARALISERDRANEIEYALVQTKKELATLSARLTRLEKSKE